MDTKGKILIVDDEVDITDFLSGFFELKGYTAEVANSGEDAVSKVTSYKPHVILLDVDKTNYPNDSYSRFLLHIASSRAAHQLWLMNYRESSPLLPDALLERIIR